MESEAYYEKIGDGLEVNIQDTSNLILVNSRKIQLVVFCYWDLFWFQSKQILAVFIYFHITNNTYIALNKPRYMYNNGSSTLVTFIF